jgi:prepilin-type N-terminal cleavage/methylation domain-containing protein
VKRILKNNKGLTLIELIVVVAILAVLAAVLVPQYTQYVEKSRKAVCESNRTEFMHAFTVYQALNGDGETLANVVSGGLSADFAALKCPSGGTITVVDGALSCSLHGGLGSGGTGGGDPGGGDPGGGDPGGEQQYFPGTTILLQPNVWPKPGEYTNNNDTITVPAGGIFQYTDGKYYVVSKETKITRGQAESGEGGAGPRGVTYSWFHTHEITGKIVTYANDSEQKSDLRRGDMCEVNGEYYVFVDGGSYAYGPTSPRVDQKSWYKLP